MRRRFSITVIMWAESGLDSADEAQEFVRGQLEDACCNAADDYYGDDYDDRLEAGVESAAAVEIEPDMRTKEQRLAAAKTDLAAMRDELKASGVDVGFLDRISEEVKNGTRQDQDLADGGRDAGVGDS